MAIQHRSRNEEVVVAVDGAAAAWLHGSGTVLVEQSCAARDGLAGSEGKSAGSEGEDGGDGFEMHDCGGF